MTDPITTQQSITDMISQTVVTMGQVELAQYFIIGIIIAAQLIIFRRGLRNNSNDDSGTLVQLGLFGTFLGIFMGLLVFNPSDIRTSMPEFLGGMKIAFLTSVTGMLGSLLLNNKVSKTINNDAGIGDLICAINEGNEKLTGGLSLINTSVYGLEKSISGDGDGSLLNQMVLLRSNLNDKFADLTSEFRDFARLQAENNTKALVEAIREVIGDFNAKINEQFGENFKQLNAAVGDLVTWQDNYKDVVEASFKQFEMAVVSMDKSKDMLELINKQYEKNLTLNKDLEKMLDVLIAEHDDLNQKMVAFKELSEEAKTAFPIINDSVNKLTAGFSEKVDDSLNTITDAYKKHSDNYMHIFSEINDNTESVLLSVGDSIKVSNQAIQDSANSMKESIESSVSDISDNIIKGFNESINHIEQLQQKFAENMEGTILQIDDALRQELEKSLQSLGSQLASLSKRFVDDYSELTNRMQQVVQIAES